jgi:hypothetical protein
VTFTKGADPVKKWPSWVNRVISSARRFPEFAARLGIPASELRPAKSWSSFPDARASLESIAERVFALNAPITARSLVAAQGRRTA